MKKHLSLFGAVLTAGMLSVPAYAADSPSYYVSGNVGVSSFSKTDVKNPTKPLNDAILTTDAGIALLGAVGVKFDCWRAEAELGYQRNNAKDVTSSNGDVSNLTGSISATTVLANGYYDFNAGGFNPYLSAGIGWASVGVNNVQDGKGGGPANQSHSAIGYQFGAGVAIPLSKTIALDARYRYFGTGTVSFDNQDGDFKITGSDFLVGVRIGL